ncbi:hypothetical protein [Bdellovibrio sp. BCCA]|uniref:hypothetical protein n=1 Tax=unclassified Bdellovibrio TaxID=2633795 RepID=UPI0025DF5841|nr:hypothetical protein [uncultured Bdellovibrio sp.]
MILNNRGQTIVESLVGLGLIAIVGSAFIGGMVSLRNTSRSTVVMSSSEKQIADIAENIKSGVENYQVNFNYKTAAGEMLAPDSLPMAWDNGKVALREDCPDCAGTYGYVIQPYESYRGLYKVTLRMTHKMWAAKGEPYKDYIFVVSAK